MPYAPTFPIWNFAGRRTMRATRRALRCRKRAILAPRGEREKRRCLSRRVLPNTAIARSAICKQSKAAPAVANRTFPHRDPKRSRFGNESAEIFRYCTASRAKTAQSAWESLFPLRFGTLSGKNSHLFTATRARAPRNQRHGTISSEISRFFTVSRKKDSTKASNAIKERKRNGKAD